ncbi:patatin-like phospholipase family protein [Streptomyces xanthochromogenes]|uniref:patatin-like phospholipase family protein n=1 Tax=Streptomyces xanthochromogenes TaxID=67384 RepID=UPI001675D497|nr:patatin-like phospholipase family protein [Streptomyces xanthochromogenes]
MGDEAATRQHDGPGTDYRCAFVLGGGGALGAYEVGMLRALIEAGIRPDLVVGTSVGAINGAAIAAEPTMRAVTQLGELWGSLGRSGVFSGSVLQRLRLAARNRTHVYSSAPLRELLETWLPARRIEDLDVPFQCVAAGIESAAEHWFTQGPLVPAVMASCAVPGLLPPLEVDGEHFFDGGLINSIPVGRAVAAGARTVYVLQVGRIEQPLQVPRAPWEVASVAFEIARRHRFTRDMTDLPEGVEVHLLPTGAASGKGEDLAGRKFRHRDFGLSGRRMDLAYEATAAYLEAAGKSGAERKPRTDEARGGGSGVDEPRTHESRGTGSGLVVPRTDEAP